jgi:stage III sporulation protein AH
MINSNLINGGKKIKMKILKKNQLVILVISLILMTAGYLNFTNQGMDKEQLSALGDATLVSTSAMQNDVQENEVQENKTIENETIENNCEGNSAENIDDNIATNNKVEEDNYFVKSKLERENIYSQMLETYQEIYNNASATAEQKKEAINKITEINNTRNSVMIAENLVQAKGFNDIVIFTNENSISVIIKTENLEADQIAQIQNIISRELNVGVELINISTK